LSLIQWNVTISKIVCTFTSKKIRICQKQQQQQHQMLILKNCILNPFKDKFYGLLPVSILMLVGNAMIVENCSLSMVRSGLPKERPADLLWFMSIIYVSNSQPGCCGTQGCLEEEPGVPPKMGITYNCI